MLIGDTVLCLLGCLAIRVSEQSRPDVAGARGPGGRKAVNSR